MLKVEIDSEEILSRSGVSKEGKPWNIREQKGYIVLPASKYPKEIKIRLEDNAPPYSKGYYTVSPASFYVGRFESLEIDLKLLPLAQ